MLVFLRLNAAVTQLAMRDDTDPARYREGVNNVNTWLSYAHYMFTWVLAAFLSIAGRIFQETVPSVWHHLKFVNIFIRRG